MTEYKIIKEEPISFGSRLDQLMREKHVSNEHVAGLLPHCSKTTVNNWRTGKHDIRRYKDKYCKILGDFFDVDPEYLKCTQLERKKTRLKRRVKKSSGLHDKYFNPYDGKYWKKFDSITIDGKKYSIFDQVAMKRASQKKDKEMRDLNTELHGVFDLMKISVTPEIIGPGGTSSAQYEILKDGVIYTVIQEEEQPQHSDRCIITLPDGSECIRTTEEIIKIYQSMKETFINNLKG